LELRSYFLAHFDIEDLRGLDLFHNRFAPDPRWNPASLAVDTSFPMNSSVSRRPTLQAPDSWNAPLTSCSWRAADQPRPKVSRSQTSDAIHTSRGSHDSMKCT
jgi:hypothetical protein